ncbi:uncharacterized protein LOC100375164 [Saccoglossus kowalevskii]|uniref:Uncharacterized protein LOC100375164 n=1 Tax=Saccoglossus kowalevskii TaxID=10224 RepID=A0ABM0M0Z5_SACKO|nr:PREDICTED: uncharacterized protein LOC100375164 [Saccoglossus kowalevskii]
MPTVCCVPFCEGKGYRLVDGHNVSFFSFPKNKNILKQWIHAIKRDPGKNFKLNRSTKICSLHFTEKDFKYTLAKRRFLLNNAVPSCFKWSESKTPSRRNPKDEVRKRICSQNDVAVITTTTEAGENIEKCVEEKEQLDKIRQLEEVISKNSTTIKSLENEVKELKKSKENVMNINQILKNEIISLNSQLETLENKCTQNEFSVRRFLNSDESIQFYTGFPCTSLFLNLFEFLDTGENAENIIYWKRSNQTCGLQYDLCGHNDNNNNNNKLGRPRKLEPLDEFFLVMCRLRQGFPEYHLSFLYNISVSTVSRIVITWINYMYLKLGSLDIWPTRQVITDTMPLSMRGEISLMQSNIRLY